MAFAWLVIPATPKPRPKIIPQTAGDTKLRGLEGRNTASRVSAKLDKAAAKGNSHLGGHWSSATCQGPLGSTLLACRVTATVAAARPMKVGTAIQLRRARRGRPQIPCPEVQPRDAGKEDLHTPPTAHPPPRSSSEGQPTDILGLSFCTRNARNARKAPATYTRYIHLLFSPATGLGRRGCPCRRRRRPSSTSTPRCPRPAGKRSHD